MSIIWTVLRVCFGVHRHSKDQYEYAKRMGIPARELDKAEWTSIGPNGGQWGT